MLRFLSLIIAVCFWSAIASVQSGEAATTSLESAIQVVRHFEDRIERIQYDSRLTLGKFADLKDIDTPTFSGDGEQNVSVVYELLTGRIKLKTWGFGKWYDGAAPFAGYNCALSFDGKQQRELEIQRGGKVPPEEGQTQGLGTISAGSDYAAQARGKFIGNWMSPTGLKHFPPLFFGKKLSTHLEEAKKKGKLRLEEKSASLWVFTMNPVDFADANGNDFHISYDPDRGIVLGGEWEINIPGRPKKVWKRIIITPTKLANGFWVPQRIDDVNLIDKNVSRRDFSKIAINQIADDKVFTITFPLHTLVVDDIDKKRYIVGEGAVKDEAAVLAYAQLHGLRLGESPPEDVLGGGGKPWIWRITLVSLAVILSILIASLWWFRKKPKRHAGLPVATVMACVMLLGLEGQAAEINAKGEWVRTGATGEKIYLSQCGWNVSMLALQCFGIGTNLQHMAETIEPREVGVRFADIQTWLEANGLTCVARKNVEMKAIVSGLKPNMMAIYVIKGSAKGYNHFVAVLNHPKRGNLYLDIPKLPILLEALVDDPNVQPLDGVVLFVSRNSRGKKQADVISVTPSLIDLGKFPNNREDAGTPKHHTITIENSSPLAVRVTGVRSSCGCVGTYWKGGVLRAGEKKQLKFWTLASGWGNVGSEAKPTTFLFADESEKSINWSGEGFADPSAPPVRTTKNWILSPERLLFTLEGESQKELVGKVRIWCEDLKENDLPESIVLTPKDKWLSGSFQRENKTSGVLTVTVRRAALLDDAPRLESKISIKLGGDVLELKVVVNRKSLFHCVPDSVVCKLGISDVTVVRLVKDASATHEIATIEVAEKPKGASVEVKPGSSVVSLRTDAVSEGVHFLVLRVTDARGVSSKHRILIRLTK